MKTEYKVFAVSVMSGLLFWIFDAVLDHLFFFRGTMLELLITDVSSHEIYIRLSVIAFFLIFGTIISRVITKRKQAEKKIEHLNLVLRAIRKVNQLITKEKDRGKLIKSVCENLIETRGYYNAWIALLDDSGKYLTSAESVFGKEFSLLIELMKSGKITACGKNALKKSDVVITEIPLEACKDCPLSVNYAGRSGMTIRLEYEGIIYGIISVSIPKKFVKDKEEHSLFKEVAEDIAFALYNIEAETEHKKAEKSLRKSEYERTLVLDNMTELIVFRNKNMETIWGSKAVSEFLEITPEENIGRVCYKARYNRNTPCPDCKVVQVLKTGNPSQYEATSPDGKYWDVRCNPVRNESGEIIGTIEVSTDITERKQAEEQIKKDLEIKSILLQEVHHRVKNNMQIISSLLKLQSAHIKDKRALELFQNSRDRVKTMALIHDALYRSQDLSNIDFADYVRKLTTQIFISYGVNSNLIKFKINIKDVLLDINTAIPCGLIINELISNSLKYAFPNGKGEISISFTYKNQVNTLCVKDNGIGFPKKIDLENSPTLGLLLVNSLTKQLDGTLKLGKVKGTSFKITFKKVELKTYGKVES